MEQTSSEVLASCNRVVNRVRLPVNAHTVLSPICSYNIPYDLSHLSLQICLFLICIRYTESILSAFWTVGLIGVTILGHILP